MKKINIKQSIIIVILLAILAAIGYNYYKNNTAEKVSIVNVSSNKKSWAISGTTSAPDGYVIVGLNDNNEQILGKKNGGNATVQEGQFKAYADTFVFTDFDKKTLESGQSIKLRVAAVPKSMMKKGNIKGYALKPINKVQKTATLKVTDDQSLYTYDNLDY